MLPLPSPTCHACRSALEPGLPLCIACGEVPPERRDPPLTVLIDGLPPDEPRRRELERLLAATSGFDEASVRQHLARPPARLRLPGTWVLAARVHEHLTAAGARCAVLDESREETSVVAYAQSLWHRKVGLAPIAGGAALSALLAARGASLAGLALLAATWAFVWMDRARFLRRLTLRPVPLARRLGLVPEALTRPASVLLRRIQSPALRAALCAVLVESARLLAGLDRLLRDHPGVQGPFREALDALGEHALRLGDQAAAIEALGEPDERDLAARMAPLRALGSAEVDRRIQALLGEEHERRHRRDSLREMRAMLLVRLEGLAAGLRSLRERAVEASLDGAPSDREATRLLEELTAEVGIAVSAVTEIERSVGERLPEAVAELVPAR